MEGERSRAGLLLNAGLALDAATLDQNPVFQWHMQASR